MEIAPLGRNDRTLDSLGIFYYVLAGVSALFACIPIFHVLMGLFVMFAPARPGQEAEGVIAGGVLVAMGITFILVGWAYAAMLFFAGKYLRARTRPTFVQVAAALSCLNMPFGTVLGILTLIELNKPEVSNQFKRPM